MASLLVDANLLHLGNKNLEHSHNCLEGKLLFPGLDLQRKIKDYTKEFSSTYKMKSLSTCHPKESFSLGGLSIIFKVNTLSVRHNGMSVQQLNSLYSLNTMSSIVTCRR